MARFSHVQFAGNVAQQIAIYHIDIKGLNTDPAAYGFALRASAVSDVFGNHCIGAALQAADPRIAAVAGPRMAQSQDLGPLGTSMLQVAGGRFGF